MKHHVHSWKKGILKFYDNKMKDELAFDKMK